MPSIILTLGLIIRKIIARGRHPERFPFLGKAQALHSALRLISALFRLGDTFEIYATRE